MNKNSEENHDVQAVDRPNLSGDYYDLPTHYGYFQVPYNTYVGCPSVYPDCGNIKSGEYVRALQAALMTIAEDYGIDCDPGSTKGIWDQITRTAVENFQAATGITVTGVAGNDTFAKLASML